jgi:predicted dehydrogenase
MAQPLRLAVLGLTHDHIWGELPDIARMGHKLIAAADPEPALRDRVHKEYGCPTYASAEQLLDKHELDAVYVFSDNFHSVELTLLALSRGLHVMREKPMASTLEGAQRMLEAAKKADRVLMVNWPFAWWPQMQHALELVKQGAIGRVWELKYRAAHIGPREIGCSPYFYNWLYDEKLNGGGAYADYTCYGCVLARVLLGRPSEVMGWRGRIVKTDIELDDNGVIVMIYPHAMAISEGSWTQIDDMTNYRPHIYGSAGTIVMEPKRGGKMWLADPRKPQGVEVTPPEPMAHMQNATAHFAWAIQSAGQLSPLCDPTMCRDAQEIMDAGLRSSASAQRVKLNA